MIHTSGGEQQPVREIIAAMPTFLTGVTAYLLTRFMRERLSAYRALFDACGLSFRDGAAKVIISGELGWLALEADEYEAVYLGGYNDGLFKLITLSSAEAGSRFSIEKTVCLAEPFRLTPVAGSQRSSFFRQAAVRTRFLKTDETLLLAHQVLNATPKKIDRIPTGMAENF